VFGADWTSGCSAVLGVLPGGRSVDDRQVVVPPGDEE